MNFKTWSLKTILIGLVVVSIIGVLLYKKATVPVEEFKYLEVVTGKLVQKVGVTGKVKPVDTANLTFEQNGKIQNVFVKVGDHVNAGNTLVKLTNEELWAQKTEALANLQKAEAQLQEVQNGTRKETIDIEEDQLDVKKTALETAKNDLLLAIEGVYPKAQYIIKSVIANLTENPSYKDAKLTFKTPHTIELNDLNNQKFYLYEMLKDWEKDFPMMTRDNEELHENATKAFLNLQQLKKFIDDLVEITPTLSSRFASTQAKVTAWAAVASATQTSVGTLITTVVDAKDALSAAERNLSVSKRELIYAESGSSDEQVAIYEASVLAAKAQVQQVQAKINKTILYAPFSGVITKVN
ncbi:MAG: biotin/lipoyl-binding protein, partial [Nanoarchaeota archaeon]|nr:biotin/lipoyl-binding protein [Nanoarchaeota archaeon]